MSYYYRQYYYFFLFHFLLLLLVVVVVVFVLFELNTNIGMKHVFYVLTSAVYALTYAGPRGWF